MTTHELTAPYIADGAAAAQGGRLFVAWKPPGQKRNVLYEVDLTTWRLKEPAIGPIPGAYYKDGGCQLFFVGDELFMLSFCSPDPTTGEEARPVLWQTGIKVEQPAYVTQAAFTPYRDRTQATYARLLQHIEREKEKAALEASAAAVMSEAAKVAP